MIYIYCAKWTRSDVLFLLLWTWCWFSHSFLLFVPNYLWLVIVCLANHTHSGTWYVRFGTVWGGHPSYFWRVLFWALPEYFAPYTFSCSSDECDIGLTRFHSARIPIIIHAYSEAQCLISGACVTDHWNVKWCLEVRLSSSTVTCVAPVTGKLCTFSALPQFNQCGLIHWLAKKLLHVADSKRAIDPVGQ